MSRPSLSLRGRVVFGALLWTAGFFAVAMIISTFMFVYEVRHRWTLPRLAVAHTAMLAAVAVIAMVAGFWLVRSGVRSVHQLRARLSAVHAGRESRVDGAYPSEVQPLVDDLNALLDHREEVVRRALAKAGDLAHGLKTPLAILAHEAERVQLAGRADLAEDINRQVERMRRQIDYHLAQARAAASGATPGAHASLAASADALARTMLRLHAGKELAIDRHLDATHTARCQREDLDEMLGNLLDNACKWARSRVVITSSRDGGRIAVTVDDDGPGLAEALRERVLQRGVRADEAAPGFGLGLAIVRDLAELYSGSIALENSPLGGLRARLMLPDAGGQG